MVCVFLCMCLMWVSKFCCVLVLMIGLMLVERWFGWFMCSLVMVFLSIFRVWLVMFFCRYRMCRVE